MGTNFLSLPMTAGGQDIPVGIDELGNTVMQTIDGVHYVVKTQNPQQGSYARAAWDAISSDPVGTAKNMLAGAWEGISAPGRAASGEPLTYGDVAATAMDWGLMNAPGLAFGKYDPANVGIFGGIGAKTADKAALARAQDMAAKGASRDDIWTETGWFAGPDGKWRFEIDDSGARRGNAWTFGGRAEGDYGDVLNHPQLNAAYPDVSKIGTGAYYGPNQYYRGHYTPYEDREYLGLFDIQEEIYGAAPNVDDIDKVLLHEGQHAIQRREGFATGGNEMVGRELSQEPLLGEMQALQDYINNSRRVLASSDDATGAFERGLAESIAEAEGDLASLQSRVAGRPRDAFSAYQRIAGEAEARNVEARRHMTAAERRATPPWNTLDVPEEDLIVRYGR